MSDLHLKMSVDGKKGKDEVLVDITENIDTSWTGCKFQLKSFFKLSRIFRIY